MLLAFLAAPWIFGLIGQLHSAEAAMRYLALSMGDRRGRRVAFAAETAAPPRSRPVAPAAIAFFRDQPS